MMILKLETLKEFQDNFPISCVGGSIGLMLHGIDLKRPMGCSDIDIVAKFFDRTKYTSNDISEISNGNFDYSLRKNHLYGRYTKIDIRINYEFSFEEIEFMGVKYNVSKKEEILFWKKIYAEKGVRKHIDDLVCIETGIRPLEPVFEDSLPF
jgi:hypothetical protein